ncbi:MAG: hypothetical protein P4L22_03705 [Candidatus Babeliales bacterium]|nr:hypothetical protein [Candidatus Babeliales bacterium]
MQIIYKCFIVLSLFSINCVTASACDDICNPQNNCNNSCDIDCSSSNVFGKTFFSYRPQDSNVARRMVGVIDTINQYESECTYGTVSASVQYSQTRNPKKLAEFFSFTGKNPMSYGPTCGEFDIYGINFGTTSTNGGAFSDAHLGTATSEGGICLKPEIKNVIFDIDLYTNWNEYLCCLGEFNLWTRFNLPLVNTKWNLHMKDTCNIKEGSSVFTPFLVSSEDNQPPVPYKDLTQAFKGNQTAQYAGKVNAQNQEIAFGDAPVLNFGRVNKEREKTALAGFHFELGCDLYKGEGSFVAAGLHMVAPTGNTPEAHYLFEPIAGANHSWQLGGTVQAGYQLWQSNCDNKNISLYFDSIVTHLFPSKQRRLFGLLIDGKTSPGSSYLLLKQYDQTGALLGLQRAANLLACETKIIVDVMADLALMLQYNSNCSMSGIGWNFWYRSKEKIECETICNVRCCPFSHNDKYAIKGDTLANNRESESASTIGSCSAIETPPVYLTDRDIDRSIALNPSAFSNKIFGFIGRNWNESEVWAPYVLLEGEVEFGNKNHAADQWAIMIKGGVSF